LTIEIIKISRIRHGGIDTKRAIIITHNGEAKAVVQDIKSYENLQNSLHMLKMIIQSENDIEKKDYLPQDEMFDNLEKRLFDKI